MYRSRRCINSLNSTLRRSGYHVTSQKRHIQTLTINSGSTTLKYSLYDIKERNVKEPPTLLASGLVDRVGKKDFSITHNKQLVEVDDGAIVNDHADALRQVIALLPKSTKIECVGHRVVHGGSDFSEPTVITPDVVTAIEKLCPLAPLHNPPALSGIRASKELFPNATHVAIFDTAFHTATMPPTSYRYAVPQNWYEEHGVRKYGFHGTSYQYLVNETAKYLKKPSSSLNMIILHLGGGASMCCVKNGVSIDTTMGLTPLEGLVMATRAGDVDVGVLDYMASSVPSMDVMDQLNKKSGLLGLSGGISSDMRLIKEKANKGNSNCQFARKVFVERCRKYLGAYYFKLQGKVDAIVFSGGIGENDQQIREDILKNLAELQLAVDPMKNQVCLDKGVGSQVMEIHPAFSKIKVLVVPTDEEVNIALQASSVTMKASKADEAEFDDKVESRPHQKASTNLFCHSLGDTLTYTANEELGLLSIFSSTIDRIGYFRPVGRNNGPDDFRITLMKKHFDLQDEPETMYGIKEGEGWKMISSGREDELFEIILKKYLAYAADKDFVMISTPTIQGDSLHFAAKLCSTLNIPAILIGDEKQDAQFGVAQLAFSSHGANCVGAICKGVENIQERRERFEQMKLQPLALLPPNEILSKLTMRQSIQALKDCVCLYGSEHLDSYINSMTIYTVQVDDLLNSVKDDDLAIMSHRRVDSLMSLILTAQSSNSSTPAGILLTQYKAEEMSPKLISLLDGLKDIRIPIIATPMDTINAANLLHSTPEFTTADCKGKIHEAMDGMSTHLDYSFLERFKDKNDSFSLQRNISPRLFQYSTFLKARKLKKTIVLPEGADPRVVEAAAILTKRKLCKIILVGDSEVIHKNADARRVSLDDITVLDPSNYHGMQDMIDGFVLARKSKGLTAIEAEEYLLQDVNYFGTMMMHLGLADGMVSGAMHSSANTIRPALQILKTAPGTSLVSSIFFMLLEDGVKVFGDCAINTMPTADQLAEIAVASAKTTQQFGIEPRVALLSYATGDSNKGELIDKVVRGTNSAKEIAKREGFMNPEMIAGPLQFDAAVDPAVAAVKAKDSIVAGQANVLIFPDLNSGNNGYKAVQQASKTVAVGPILQGLKKPVNDLSRGATVDDIVNTAVITALQVEGESS